MKCQKCNAENINEAVKCGMCGAKLKHATIFNDFTGSQHVESSIRRDPQSNTKQGHNSKKNSRPQQFENIESRPPSTTQRTSNLVDTVLDKNLPIEEKARIFLDSWQEKAKDKINQSNKPKKKQKWLFLIIFFIIFGLPIVKKVGTVIYDEVSYQIRERTRIANEAEMTAASIQDEVQDAVAEAVPVLTLELEQEIVHINQEMKMIQEASNTFYLDHHTLPTKLKDLSSTELSLIDRNVYAQTEILSSGAIINTLKDNPEIQLIYDPEVSDNGTISWTCYSVGAEVEGATGCVLLPANPFADE